MHDRLRELVMGHTGGIPGHAPTDDDLYDALEAHLIAQDCQSNELLNYLARARDHILSAIECLDSDEYDELLGPCISSPEEVVEAARILRELVTGTGTGMDYHIVLVDDGKMWNVFVDGGEPTCILPLGCMPVLGQYLKYVLSGLDGHAVVEAPFHMVSGLVSGEPLGGVWAEVARILDEGGHELVANYEFVVDS